jgi:hypothetical protein
VLPFNGRKANTMSTLNGVRSTGPLHGRKPASRVPLLALSVEQACESLGVSWKLWRSEIEPDVAVVRCGRRKMVSVAELERWLSEHGERVGLR